MGFPGKARILRGDPFSPGIGGSFGPVLSEEEGTLSLWAPAQRVFRPLRKTVQADLSGKSEPHK